jgi:hypothetical protein
MSKDRGPIEACSRYSFFYPFQAGFKHPAVLKFLADNEPLKIEDVGGQLAGAQTSVTTRLTFIEF